MTGYRIIFGLVIGVIVIIGFNKKIQLEARLEEEDSLEPGWKTALTEPLMLPIFLAMIFFSSLIYHGFSRSEEIVAKSALLFLYISIYYFLLLLLIPFLRRIVSAQACATLWMIPSFLYFAGNGVWYETQPLFVITLSRQWFPVFAWVWAAGFAGVMVFQAISHFRFRRSLVKHAERATDDHFLSLWHTESEKHGLKVQIPVLISERVNTPLSIGCFDRTMRLVLPKQDYTDEEIFLIVRHELRHIVRADARTKLFLDIYTAVCWFNPLAWIARRKAADDLELSCDAAILSGAPETTLELYASLLLKSAGDCQGYSTRLSTAASALRYRLKSVMKPGKRLTGGVVVGAALFLLVLSVGTVALADSATAMREAVLEIVPAGSVINAIETHNLSADQPNHKSVYRWDKSALATYLGALRVKRVYSGAFTAGGDRSLRIDYGKTVDGDAQVTFLIYDGLLFAYIPSENYRGSVFILEDTIDWGYIESLLDFDAKDPFPVPFPPDLMLYFNEEINAGGELMHASKSILSVIGGAGAKDVSEPLYDESIGGVSGYPVTQVKLHFSYAPKGNYKIKVKNWLETASYTVSSNELTDDVLPLAPYNAHYTVYGTFATVRNTTYEMEFYFDVELPAA